MKYFIVEIIYKWSLEEITQVVAEHRKFLQTGYDKGWLLLSGPLEPRTGGVIVARAPSRADLESFFQQDPYYLKNAAEHRIVEFNPVMSQEFMKPWLSG